MRQTSASEYVDMTTDCARFIQTRDYVTKPLTSTERGFPLAFSILMYKDVEQFERLLRAIYRPQNFYCVHVDRNTRDDVQLAVQAVTSCFENVFVPDDCLHVKWGDFTVLQAELVCMRHLLKRKPWRSVQH